jgi:acyl carrier protein
VEGYPKDAELPATDGELVDRIRGFVADALDCPIEQVGLDDHIYETLGLDSLGSVAVFVDLFYEFGVPEPDIDFNFASLYSVRSIAEYARSFGRGPSADEPS